MTDASEATPHTAPQEQAPLPHRVQPAQEQEQAVTSDSTSAAAEGAGGAEHVDRPRGAEGEEAEGTANAPRARRSRGGRGKRRSGQAAQVAGGPEGSAEGHDGSNDGTSSADAENVDHAAPGGEGNAPQRAERTRQQPRQPRPPREGQQPRGQQQASPQKPQQQQQPRKVHPVLERLFELYPKMFGARFLPLKIGVYQELLEKHGDEFKNEDLKVALGLHARSTRYLDSVAAGHQRHNLDGEPVEPVAPEHVHHAILEVFRRRQQRAKEDLGGQLRDRIIAAIEASGIGRDEYAARVRARDENSNAALDDALAELARQAAKREALLRAFEASAKTEPEFADMYGMDPKEVARTLQRARSDNKRAEAKAAADAAAAAQAAIAEPAAETETETEAIEVISEPEAEAGTSPTSDEARPLETPPTPSA